MTKRSFSGKGLKANQPLDLIHSDVCGPINVKARGGYEYFVIFIDDYTTSKKGFTDSKLVLVKGFTDTL